MPVETEADIRNWPEFQRELATLINKHSLERPSNLPDYVLAEYLTQCLVALNVALLTTSSSLHEREAKQPGMSLRDWFAGMAMQGMYAGNACTTDGDTGGYARAAYAIADAMLEIANAGAIKQPERTG